VARTRTRSLDQADDNAEQEVAVVSDSRRRRRGGDADADKDVQASDRKDRPTPSARQLKPRGTAASVGFVDRIPVVRNIVEYFRGVSTELRKVTWPTREETRRLTLIVLGVTAFFAITLGAISLFFTWWFQQAFHADSEDIFLLVGVGVAIVAAAVYTMFRRLEV
jgi:preprotein translocase SecE subunit